MIKVLYFARFRDTLDCGEETLALPEGTTSIAQLVARLSERGQTWHDTLNGPRVLVAVNQEITDFDAPVNDGDEIAFFPPVTGG